MLMALHASAPLRCRLAPGCCRRFEYTPAPASCHCWRLMRGDAAAAPLPRLMPRLRCCRWHDVTLPPLDDAMQSLADDAARGIDAALLRCLRCAAYARRY